MVNKIFIYNCEESLIDISQAKNTFLRNSIQCHIREFRYCNGNEAEYDLCTLLKFKNICRFELKCRYLLIQRIILRDYYIGMESDSKKK